MSTPPDPPYGHPPPYGYQSPYAAPPKRRPSAWWFLPGLLSFVFAALAATVAIVILVGTYPTDGYLAADGTSHRVVLKEDGDRMLFMPAGTREPGCAVSDDAGPVQVARLGPDRSSVDIDSGEWIPFAEFTSTGRDIEVICSDLNSTVRVGAPMGDDELIKIGGFAVAAVVLGLIGAAATITVGILFYTRRPKPFG